VTDDRLQDFASRRCEQAPVISAGGIGVQVHFDVIFDEKTFVCNGRETLTLAESHETLDITH
jgi:hypothetical protein